VTDSPGHPDLDALADVLAGGDDAHLRTCASCRERLAELAAADASVSAALAALPAPPLPDGLTARLERALWEERLREERQARAAGHPARRRAPAWLPAAAAAVALVLAGGVGVSLLDLSGQGSSDTAASGGAGQDESGAGESAADDSAMDAAAPRTRTGTGTDWADGPSRTAALPRLLAPADTSASGATAFSAGDGLDRLRDPAALAACLAALPGGDADVLAVDYARYAGAPALAVVQADGPDLVEVTVVGSGCSAADPQVLGSASLPRP